MSVNLRHYYLQQMGIEPWIIRQTNSHKSNLVACENTHSKLMIISDARGIDEAQKGLPILGKAGNLLTKMLSSIGLSEEDIYIVNVAKCGSLNSPNAEEVSQCSDYLVTQITLVAPKLILVLSHFAGQCLLKVTLPLMAMRGKTHYFLGIPVVVSHHPDHLLLHPADKKTAYDDMLLVKQLLNSELSVRAN